MTQQERDVESLYDYFGARYYDARIGRWLAVDPKAVEGPEWSPYAYVDDAPLSHVDPKGERKWPVPEMWKGLRARLDDPWGPRDVKVGSKFHHGGDFNSGSGNDDYGMPVLATHDGKVVAIHGSKSGTGGRYVEIESFDGRFKTRYLHLKEIKVKVGSTVFEGDKIAEVGGSYEGKELGLMSHLHYEIWVWQSPIGKMAPIDPTGGHGRDSAYLIDPQQWLQLREALIRRYLALLEPRSEEVAVVPGPLRP